MYTCFTFASLAMRENENISVLFELALVASIDKLLDAGAISQLDHIARRPSSKKFLLTIALIVVDMLDLD